MAKLSAASVALIGGADVNTSIYAAGNAVENNFFFLGVFIAPEIVAAAGTTLAVGKVLWEIYAITHEEELEQTREEICQYVGEKLDIEADTVGFVYDGLMMAGSVAGALKQGGKALFKKSAKEAVHTGASAVHSEPGSTPSAPHSGVDGKGVAKDIDLRVKNVDNTSGPRIGFKGRDYVRDMETRSGVPIGSEQRGLLKEALQGKDFKKLSPVEKNLHKNEFKRTKENQIKVWEHNTGQKWPTYQENYYSTTGKLLAEKGDLYQAHHIIPQQIGGPNKWWNFHPLEIKDHQQGIHTINSSLHQIMKDIK